jgi:hypothetical protein
MELAKAYGTPEMDIGDFVQEEQSVNEEYHAYVTAHVSSKGTDILRFWEAGVAFTMGEKR